MYSNNEDNNQNDFYTDEYNNYYNEDHYNNQRANDNNQYRENNGNMSKNSKADKDLKRAQKQEKKALKRQKKEQRQLEGKYYFWEFNKNNFSALKILEVNFFFYISIGLGIIFLITPAFAISNVTNPWQLFMFLFPALIIVWGVINRFLESVLSNSKNNGLSLIIQRLIGIIYIIVLTIYSFVLISVLVNANGIVVIELKWWLVVDLIFVILLIGLKTFGVCLYGTFDKKKYVNN